MLDEIVEFIFMCIFEGLILSSARETPKKIKIVHAIFRTIFYLCLMIIFLFLGINLMDLGKWLCFMMMVLFCIAMIRTNWVSYKRQEEWEVMQKNASLEVKSVEKIK